MDTPNIMNFNDLNLSPTLLQAIGEQGYSSPSPIQIKAIPPVLAGKDVMAAAQTGTGKTAGFTLPILQNLSTGPRANANQARALIITPTRELAAQVGESVATYGRHLPLRSTVVFGGVKINPQMMRLRKGVDVLVATPGRLLDLYNQNAVRFDQLEVLGMAKGARMLDMGFIHDIRKIIALLPKQRQNLMFSATFSEDIRKLAKTIVHDPIEISVSPRNTTVESVKHWICPVDKSQKSALLTKLIKDNDWQQVLVFSRTKHGANRLTRQLEERGIKAAAIHGNKSQGARTRALADFKQGKLRALVATDIAARGIDINQLPQVVNFDLPNVPEDYVHRIGRTGRAGQLGQAVSLVSADEIKQLTDIERLIKTVLERRLIDGFEPVHDLPASSGNFRPIKAKKPKKPHHHQAGEGRHGGKQPGKNANRHGQANNGNSGRKKPGGGNKSVSKSSPWAKASAKRRSQS